MLTLLSSRTASETSSAQLLVARQMRTPQEVPSARWRPGAGREVARLRRARARRPTVIAPLAAVHGMNYLRFLQEAHRRVEEDPAGLGRRSDVEHLRARRHTRCAACSARRRVTSPTAVARSAPTPTGSAYWSAQSAVARRRRASTRARAKPMRCAARPATMRARSGGRLLLPEQRGNRGAGVARALRRAWRSSIPTCTTARACRRSSTDATTCCTCRFTAIPTNFYPVVAGMRTSAARAKATATTSTCRCRHGAGAGEGCSSSSSTRRCACSTASAAMRWCSPLGFDIYKDDPQSMVAVTTEELRPGSAARSAG